MGKLSGISDEKYSEKIIYIQIKTHIKKNALFCDKEHLYFLTP